MSLRPATLISLLLTVALSVATLGLAGWSIKSVHHQKAEILSSLDAVLHAQDLNGSAIALIVTTAFATLLSLFYAVAPAPSTKRALAAKEWLFLFQTCFILAAIIPATTIFCIFDGHIYQAGYAATPVSEITDSGLDLAYIDQKPARCYVIVGWLAWLASCVSYVLVAVATRRERKAAEVGEKLAEQRETAEVTRA